MTRSAWRKTASAGFASPKPLCCFGTVPERLLCGGGRGEAGGLAGSQIAIDQQQAVPFALDQLQLVDDVGEAFFFHLFRDEPLQKGGWRSLEARASSTPLMRLVTNCSCLRPAFETRGFKLKSNTQSLGWRLLKTS